LAESSSSVSRESSGRRSMLASRRIDLFNDWDPLAERYETGLENPLGEEKATPRLDFDDIFGFQDLGNERLTGIKSFRDIACSVDPALEERLLGNLQEREKLLVDMDATPVVFQSHFCLPDIGISTHRPQGLGRAIGIHVGPVSISASAEETYLDVEIGIAQQDFLDTLADQGGNVIPALFSMDLGSSYSHLLSGNCTAFNDALTKLSTQLHSIRPSRLLHEVLGLVDPEKKDVWDLIVTVDLAGHASLYPAFDVVIEVNIRDSLERGDDAFSALCEEVKEAWNKANGRVTRNFHKIFQVLQMCLEDAHPNGLLSAEEIDAAVKGCNGIVQTMGSGGAVSESHSKAVAVALVGMFKIVAVLIKVAQAASVEISRVKESLLAMFKDMANPLDPENVLGLARKKLVLSMIKFFSKDFKNTLADVPIPTGGSVGCSLYDNDRGNDILVIVQRFMKRHGLRVANNKVVSTVRVLVDTENITGGTFPTVIFAEDHDAIPESLSGHDKASSDLRSRHRVARREIAPYLTATSVFDTNVEIGMGLVDEMITRALLEDQKMKTTCTFVPASELGKVREDDPVVCPKLLLRALATLPGVLSALGRVSGSNFDIPNRHRRAFLDGVIDISLDFGQRIPKPDSPIVIPYRNWDYWHNTYLLKGKTQPTLKFFHYPMAGHARSSRARYLCAMSDHDYPIAPHYRTLVDRQPGDPLTHNYNMATDGMAMYRASAPVGPQMAKLLVGNSKTGKSTHVDLVVNMFPSKYEANIGGSEGVFGQQNFTAETMLGHTQEMGPSMAVSSIFMQSAIGRDRVTVAVKHGEPREFVWQTFLIMAGNMIGPWLDTAGSMLRRLMIFLYTNRFVLESQTINDDTRADVGPTLLLMFQMYMQMRVSRASYTHFHEETVAPSNGGDHEGLEDADGMGDARLEAHVREIELAKYTHTAPSFFQDPSPKSFCRTRLEYADHTSRLAALLTDDRHRSVFVRCETTTISKLLDHVNRRAAQNVGSGGNQHSKQRAQLRFDHSMISNLAEVFNIDKAENGELFGLCVFKDFRPLVFLRVCCMVLLGIYLPVRTWCECRYGAQARVVPEALGDVRSDDDEDRKGDADQQAERASTMHEFCPHFASFEELDRSGIWNGVDEEKHRYVMDVFNLTDQGIRSHFQSLHDEDKEPKMIRALWNYEDARKHLTSDQAGILTAVTDRVVSGRALTAAMQTTLEMCVTGETLYYRYPDLVRRRDYAASLRFWPKMIPPLPAFELRKGKQTPRHSNIYAPPADLQPTPINKHHYPSICALVLLAS
jgi:hypothetical protein